MDDVKSKIRKLLAMATDARGNEHENETAMRQAEALMRKHNIEVADIEASTGKQTVYQWRSITIPMGEKAVRATWRPLWLGFLGVGVAQFTDTKVTSIDDPTYGCCSKFQGDEQDLEYAAWLFKKLRDFGYAESKSVPYAQRDAFCKAYAIQLCSRMKALRAEREAALRQAVTKTGTALMVLQNKIALRDVEFGAQRIKTSRVKYSSQGFHEGRAAANRATFNRPIGSGARALLS